MNSDEQVSKASVLIESAIKFRSILHGFDDRRLKIYRIYYSKLFSAVMDVCLVIIIILPFFEWPSSLTKSSDLRNKIDRPVVPCGILESIEYICLLVFLVRALMMAYMFWKDEFLRNKWLIGQFIVTGISFVDLSISTSMHCTEFYRVRRFLRPYFLISSSQILKKTIKCLWNTIPELASFLFLLMLWILTATIAAMCLFSGPLRQKNLTSPSSKFYSSDRVGLGWLYETFYSLIVLLTTANHPDVILPNYNENRATAFFDIAFIAVGTYVFMNIFTAIMYNQFRGYLLSSMQKRIFRRRVAVRAAYEVLKSPSPAAKVEVGSLLQVLKCVSLPAWKKAVIVDKLTMQYGSTTLSLNEFMDTFRLLDLSSPPRQPIIVRPLSSPMASRLQTFWISDTCRRLELCLCLINVFCIIIQLVAFEDAAAPSFTFLMINTAFASLYMVEIGISFWVHGWRNSLRIPLALFDALVSIGNLALRFFEIALMVSGIRGVGPEGWSPYDLGQVGNLLVMLRTLRFMQISGLMTAVLVQMPRHLAPVLGILLSAFYVFALLGLALFRGTLPPPSDEPNATSYQCGTYQQLGYWSINFDDFAASIYTLWSLMVLNNWHVIVRVFTEQRGRWVHIYMLSWWLIAAVVLLTLITAMIIESFLFARQMHNRQLEVLQVRQSRRRALGHPRRRLCPLLLRRQYSSSPTDRDSLIIDDVSAEREEMVPISATAEVAGDATDDGDNVRTEILLPSQAPAGLGEMFGVGGGVVTAEPTTEELERHLRRHAEICGLLHP